MAVLTIHRLLFVLLLLPVAAGAALPPDTRWADPTNVELNVTFPGDGYEASWTLFRCDCGDLLVRAELAVPGEAVRGDLVLVDNRAVLSRGFGQYRDEAASSLDAAALMMQLALRLLERVEPGGPSRIDSVFDVDVEDAINHINLDTGTAVGGFLAPWSIKGRIQPTGEEKRRFDLTFQFSVPAEGESVQSSMRLYGETDFADTPFPVEADSSLEGWDLSWRDEQDSVAGQPKTLAELRELLKKN